jgi:hypothetical protein
MSDTKGNVMIEVRIRHVDETKSRHLMTWPVDNLDGVIPLIEHWGVRVENSTDDFSGYDLSGTFVIADGLAFFEVMLDDSGTEG